ncbi:MAG: hypothetical protein AB7N76_26835 [Planctomycetota bacterium]
MAEVLAVIAAAVVVALVAATLAPAEATAEPDDEQALLHAKGRAVMAVWVMANAALAQGQRSAGPALGLIDLSRDPERHLPALLRLAKQLYRLYTTPAEELAQLDPLEREVARQVQQDVYEPHRRKRVPRALTGGREVYMVDLWLEQSCLEHPQRLVPCLVTGGSQGLIGALRVGDAEGDRLLARCEGLLDG